MTQISRKLNIKASLAALSAAIVLSATSATAVHAQAGPGQQPAPATFPNAEFQYGTLTGTTNTINVSNLPVALADGTISNQNVTIPISVSVSETGVVTLVAGDITTTPAPIPEVNSFIAGYYVGPGGGTDQLLTLIGPGSTSNGATMWSITTTAGETGCAFPTTATFYVGPLTSNPLYPRLQAAGITNTSYSYGVMGAQTCSGDGLNSYWWNNGHLIGAIQTGNALTIASFDYGGDDQSTPGSPITYILSQPLSTDTKALTDTKSPKP